ncbi:RDD family protein [Streptomyces sp. NPDC002490]|uniref:RDD family protein n=1 Tax=Streptomyces sp. NPDC002490 TaxID=3154416 RepID=UPI0033267335
MSDLVTGEAVTLELRPARLPSRGLALAIDLTVALGVYLGVTAGLVAATSSLDEAAFAAVTVASFLLLLVGVPIAVETLSRGRSLGKLVCGLRVVRDDGGPIRFRHALVRGAVGAVEILGTFGVVAMIASLVSARGRRVGDVLAGTLVVRERVPKAVGGQLPPPPPWLVGRFAGVDLSGVPDEVWLAVRQYLSRMSQFDPQAGAAMGQRLAWEVARLTGAAVPEGVPAAAFLAAVVHERRSRDASRMAAGGGPGGGAGAWAGAGYGPGTGAGGGFAAPGGVGGGAAVPPAAPPAPAAPAAAPPSSPSSSPGAAGGSGTGFAPPG